MFKTIFIKNISKSYSEQVSQHNFDIAKKKYLSTYGLYNGHINNRMEEYELCFLLQYENYLGKKENIKFAYKYNDKNRYSEYDYKPDIIIGGNIHEREPKEAIYRFCAKYGEYLLDGYDIVDIVENDPENILNYIFEKKFSKRKKKINRKYAR